MATAGPEAVGKKDLEATVQPPSLGQLETGALVVEETKAEVAKDTAALLKEKEDRQLSPEQQEGLLRTLQTRFESKDHRKLHPGVQWAEVEKTLKANPELLWSLQQMENTGGEPDVLLEDETSFVFGDCSEKAPIGRRNVVYDPEAEEQLPENYPKHTGSSNAVDMAAQWGVDLMDEEVYRGLQTKLSMEKNTWIWLKTPAHIRKSGFALCANRYGNDLQVHPYHAYNHNPYGGFRCVLRVAKTV